MLIRSVVLWTLYNTTLTRNGRKLLMVLYHCPVLHRVYTHISHRVIRPHQCAPYRITTCLPRVIENGGELFVKW